MIDRLLLVLRWVALAIALLLNLWAEAPAGFTHEPETAIFAVAAYNAFVSLAWVRRDWLTPRRLLIADTLVFTLGVAAAGGWHSSLYVLYFLVVLAAALHLSPVLSLGYTSLACLLYTAACVLVPNWDWGVTSIEVLIGRTTVLLFTGLIAATLDQQIETERRIRKGEQEINSRLTVLNDLMSLELGSKLDVGKTLDVIARLARRAISAEFSAVCLFPVGDGQGYRFAFDGVPLAQQGSLFRESHLDPIGEVVARTGQPLLIADISHETAEIQAISAFYKCRSLVCVPIKLEDAVIGVLYNGMRTPSRIQQTDVDLLMAMGRHTALAIANAEMYDQERSNAARLAKLEQMKSDFLSSVSHQLRTPITSIATAADLMRSADENLSDDQRKLVHNIARNSVRLDNLVTDILEMARMKDGRMQLALQPLSAATLANDAVAGVRLLLEARSQQVEVRVDPALPRLEVDRRRVEHVLGNLLYNAGKFTQPGGTIVVEAEERGGWIEFSVRDNGPGMDREVRERAFEPFFSADGAEGKGGTGLGLAIARGLVELHGGEISLESAPGAGTTVRFTLPVSTEGE